MFNDDLRLSSRIPDPSPKQLLKAILALFVCIGIFLYSVNQLYLLSTQTKVDETSIIHYKLYDRELHLLWEKDYQYVELAPKTFRVSSNDLKELEEMAISLHANVICYEIRSPDSLLNGMGDCVRRGI